MSSSNLNMEVLREMGNLRRSGEVPTDVVLVCEGGTEVAAHGLLCAALSPVLRAALRKNLTRTVKLEWARADLIQRVLDFACGGDRLSREDAMDLLPIADRLDFASLRLACEDALASRSSALDAGVVAPDVLGHSMGQLREIETCPRDEPTADLVAPVSGRVKRMKTEQQDFDLLDLLGADVLSDVVLPFLDPLDVADGLEPTSRKMRDFLAERKYWCKIIKEQAQKLKNYETEHEVHKRKINLIRQASSTLSQLAQQQASYM